MSSPSKTHVKALSSLLLRRKPQIRVQLTQQEQNLLSLAATLYNDIFPTILQLNEHNFMNKLSRYIMLAVHHDTIVPSASLTKVLAHIKREHYDKDYTSLTQQIQSINNINTYPTLQSAFVVPHCNQMNTFQPPVHPCGEHLYFLTNTVLICLKCQLVYHSSTVLLYCTHCSDSYYSSVNMNYQNVKYTKAAFNTQHCKTLLNEPMRCSTCHDYLYINTSNNKLCCLACAYEIESNHLQMKCATCGSEFITEAKRFNSTESYMIDITVKEILDKAVQARPVHMTCCGITDKDIERYMYTHKKECNGVLYEGKVNKDDVVVCSKCKEIKYKEQFEWMCPICKGKMKRNEGGGDKRKMKMKIMVSGMRKLGMGGSAFKKSGTQDKGESDSDDDGGVQFIKRTKTNFKKVRNDDNIMGLPISSRGPMRVVGDKERMSYVRKMKSQGGNKQQSGESESNVNEDSNCNSNINNSSHCKSEVSKLFHIRHISNQLTKSSRNKFSHPLRMIHTQHYDNDYTPYDNKNGHNNGNPSTPTSSSLHTSLHKFISPFNPNPPNKVQFNLNNINININVTSSSSSSKEPNNNNNNNNAFASFSIDDYTIQKQIGAGTFGKIYEVTDAQGKRYAMKKILTSSQSEITSLTSEYEIMHSLSNNPHVNLVKIHAMQTKQLDKTTHVMYVLMDLAIRDWEKEITIRNSKKQYYKEQELLQILKQLVTTFAELQRRNISHRDIKPQNILLFDNNVFRISDFGEAKEMIYADKNDKNDTIKQTIRGTELYMSPLLFKALKEKGIQEKYTEHNSYKSDVFSLGLCLLLAATLTFNALVDIREVEDMISLKMKVGRFLKGRYTARFNDMLYMMLEMNEKLRCDFVELEKYVERL